VGPVPTGRWQERKRAPACPCCELHDLGHRRIHVGYQFGISNIVVRLGAHARTRARRRGREAEWRPVTERSAAPRIEGTRLRPTPPAARCSITAPRRTTLFDISELVPRHVSGAAQESAVGNKDTQVRACGSCTAVGHRPSTSSAYWRACPVALFVPPDGRSRTGRAADRKFGWDHARASQKAATETEIQRRGEYLPSRKPRPWHPRERGRTTVPKELCRAPANKAGWLHPGRRHRAQWATASSQDAGETRRDVVYRDPAIRVRGLRAQGQPSPRARPLSQRRGKTVAWRHLSRRDPAGEMARCARHCGTPIPTNRSPVVEHAERRPHRAIGCP